MSYHPHLDQGHHGPSMEYGPQVGGQSQQAYGRHQQDYQELQQPVPVPVQHELFPAPPHLGIDGSHDWGPDGSSSSYPASYPPSASFPAAYEPSAPFSTSYPASFAASSSYPPPSSAYNDIPTSSPFPPPRLSPPLLPAPRLPHNLHQMPHTNGHEHHINGGSHLMNPNGHRLTLAGSLDPSTGIFYRSPEHPRLRTAQACEKCRTRKAKCSGEHPSCKRCTTRGLVCEYAKEGRVRGPNKPKIKVEAKDGEDSKKTRKAKNSSAKASSDDDGDNRGKEKASGKAKTSRIRVKEESSSPGVRPRRTPPDSNVWKIKTGSSTPTGSSPSNPALQPPDERPLSTSVPLEHALSGALGHPLSMGEHRASRTRPPNLLLHTAPRHFGLDSAPRSASFHSTPPHSGVSVGFDLSPPLPLPPSHLHSQQDFTPVPVPLFGADPRTPLVMREYSAAGDQSGEGEYAQGLERGYEQSRERYSEQQQQGWTQSESGAAYVPTERQTTYGSSASDGMVYGSSAYVASDGSGTYVASDGSGTTYVASDGSGTAYVASSESPYGSERPGTGSSRRSGSGSAAGVGEGYVGDGYSAQYTSSEVVTSSESRTMYGSPGFGYRGGETCVESIG